MRNGEIEILVVEDNVADARLIKEALADTGLKHHLSCSVDGEAAIGYLRECCREETARRPDVIVLDLNMPKVDGHMFLKLMREEPKFADIPVIVLTVSQDDEDVMKALELGMNFYLRKPPSANTIGPLLDRMVSLWC